MAVVSIIVAYAAPGMAQTITEGDTFKLSPQPRFEVVEGDTVKFAKQLVRMFGIDAAEKG